ncbi:hypothetical protein SLUN_18385 [Streptomyces lunaelactis]|uniref:Uncharacterized protein n=1 Tax=Streptomyces lunaelactis TaxID=1535768 RepID=A0A2R4T425_9ACTN|nr:hypothetical protein [Streptomyces lunaelactis]AVZ73851.1 hypothetical protein SLUN_18385 [Streptomyces lunaelactis]NUK88554.1 hypothetical protein [Streptomyces lunaelactis]
MTEQPATLEIPESPESAPEILATPKEPRRIDRRLVVGVSVVLALAVVAGGGFWALDRLGDADRTAPTVVWAEPAGGAADDGKAAQPKGLAASLLPVPYGYELGPDIDVYGNDTVLSKRQAVAVFKEGSRGLPSAQRNQRNKAVDKLKLQGVAMRSYRSFDGGFAIEVQLAQIENAGKGRELAQFQSAFADALGIFRKGPAIQGYKNAKCFLMPKDSKAKLDAMFCSAYQGDVLMNATAYGVKPLDTIGAAAILSKQLDHLKSPGEYV